MTPAPESCPVEGCPHAKMWRVLACAFGFLGVVAGALGAHATPGPVERGIVENAAVYQLIHALLLLYAAPKPGLLPTLAKTALVLGIILFSIGLTLKYVGGMEAAGLAAPAGGLCYMLGWLSLGLSAMLDKNATHA